MKFIMLNMVRFNYTMQVDKPTKTTTPVAVNPAKILYFYPAEATDNSTVTTIVFGDEAYIEVSEHPDTVMEEIKNALSR